MALRLYPENLSLASCAVARTLLFFQRFERPYFVVPKLEGDVLRMAADEWGSGLREEQRLDLGAQIMRALAGIHRVDPASAPYLGEPLALTTT